MDKPMKRWLVLALLTVSGVLPAFAVPTITANPNPVIVPAGQSEGTTTVTWNAGPNYKTARVWLQVGQGEATLFAGVSNGTLQTSIPLGQTETFKLISGDGVQTLASVEVTAQAPASQGVLGKLRIGSAVAKHGNISALLNSFIKNSYVEALGNSADISFDTKEACWAQVEVSKRKINDFPIETPAGQQPVSAFPAGAVTLSVNDSLGPQQTKHTMHFPALAPNTNYSYVITATASDGRKFRDWGTLKTLDNRRVTVVFEKVNFTKKELDSDATYPNGRLVMVKREGLQLHGGINDQWGTVGTGYWRYPRDGSFADIGGLGSYNNYRPAGWETININARIDRAPDHLLLRLLACDRESRRISDPNGFYTTPTFPTDPRPKEYPASPHTDAGYGRYNPYAYWSTASGDIDTTMGGTYQPGTVSFHLYQSQEAISISQSHLLFEVEGHFTVSYLPPPRVPLVSDKLRIGDTISGARRHPQISDKIKASTKGSYALDQTTNQYLSENSYGAAQAATETPSPTIKAKKRIRIIPKQ
ncbi:hypothetical protein IAD21_06364 [Abditibacteriota bacterium]|nr:hypothetical protein IAD21_06364 [Abditibacteriota bacterium]